MGRALWLPSVLRSARLTVHEEPGWRTRGSSTFDPVAVVCHATAGSRTATDRQEINVIAYTGSATAPAPIAQLYLSRTGQWWVIASGRCNHIGDAALPGTGKAGNRYAIGIEAANDNRGEPWPQAQYDSYVRGVAAICRHMGWNVDRVFGHKEISYTGKTDPTFGMTTFRERVRAALNSPLRRSEMLVLVRKKGQPAIWLSNLITRRWIRNEAELETTRAWARRLYGSDFDTRVMETDNLDAFGVPVGPQPREGSTTPDADSEASAA